MSTDFLFGFSQATTSEFAGTKQFVPLTPGPSPARGEGRDEITPLSADHAAAQLCYARQIIGIESRALESVAAGLNHTFCQAVDLLLACRGSVLVSGMGKAGLVGQKIAATLASTGTRSHFLHPAEAIHGDLGRIHRDDVVLMLSQSGETEEVVRLLASIEQIGATLVAITGRPNSKLGHAAKVVLNIGALQEACSLGLAPSTSTTAMLAMGDALALVASRQRGFTRDDFAKFHPGGSLGRQLARVEESMRTLDECRLASCGQTLREVLAQARLPARRTGAIMIVDPQGTLRGVFTDSDLARLFESRRDALLDGPIREVMTKNPARVPLGSMLPDAVTIMAERRISELPVVDSDGRPVGLLDITDLVGMFPEGRAALWSTQSANSSVVPRPKNPALLDPRRNLQRGGA